MESHFDRLNQKNNVRRIIHDLTNETAQRQETKRAECPVSGSLAVMLRVSRLCALAPVKFARRRGGQVVRVSRTYCIVGNIVMTVFNVIGFVGLVIDLYLPPDQSTVTPTVLGRVSWFSDYSFVMVTTSIIVYGAEGRVEELISFLSRIHKIKMSLSAEEKVPYSEWKKNTAFVLFIIFTWPVVIGTYIKYLVLAVTDDTETSLIPVALYAPYETGYVMLLLQEVQYGFIALEVCQVLTLLNDKIEKMTSPYCADQYTQMPKAVEVRGFAADFAIICEGIKQLDQANGLVMIICMLSYMLQLVVIPYRMITMAINDKNGAFTNQPIWFFLHFFRLLLIIEPSNSTLAQIERTRLLVGKLMLLNPDSLVYVEAEKFHHFLLLNKVGFTPMGICTLLRSLLFSLTGSIITYIVIIVQFQNGGLKEKEEN